MSNWQFCLLSLLSSSDCSHQSVRTNLAQCWLIGSCVPPPSPPCYANKPQLLTALKDIKISGWTIQREQIIFPCQMSITGRLSGCSCCSWEDLELRSITTIESSCDWRLENTVNTWAPNDLLIAMNAYYCYVVLPDYPGCPSLSIYSSCLYWYMGLVLHTLLLCGLTLHLYAS